MTAVEAPDCLRRFDAELHRHFRGPNNIIGSIGHFEEVCRSDEHWPKTLAIIGLCQPSNRLEMTTRWTWLVPS